MFVILTKKLIYDMLSIVAEIAILIFFREDITWVRYYVLQEL